MSTEILPNLFLGNFCEANDYNIVISCEIECRAPNVVVLDGWMLPFAIFIINKSLQEGRTVLVHKSATIVASYLMIYRGMTREEAIKVMYPFFSDAIVDIV